MIFRYARGHNWTLGLFNFYFHGSLTATRHTHTYIQKYVKHFKVCTRTSDRDRLMCCLFLNTAMSRMNHTLSAVRTCCADLAVYEQQVWWVENPDVAGFNPLISCLSCVSPQRLNSANSHHCVVSSHIMRGHICLYNFEFTTEKFHMQMKAKLHPTMSQTYIRI